MKKHSLTSVNFFSIISRLTLSFFIFLITIITASKVQAQSGTEKPGIFYAVSGNGLKDTSYLFGTYHLIKGSYLHELPGVMKAFEKSKGVIVEVVIDSAELGEANAKALLKGKQLTDLLDKTFADSLNTVLQNDVGAGLAQFNSLKPMTVMLTLSMVYVMKDNQAVLTKFTGSPLDVSFVEKAKSGSKSVTPLETINQQMDLLFNTSSEEEQVEALKRFIRKREANIKMGNDLLKVYFDNDLAAVEKIYEKALQDTGEEDYLVKQRNANWMKVLPGLLKESSWFIAVGTLHLAGEYGLVAQLKKQGFTVTPLKL